MGDDKPFECTEPGCGMRFTNEDHLGVHKAKHQMSLALTSGKAGSIITFVADQTPTPTKFLRNCEEFGLFHDLSKNPFEEAFKKAFSEGKVHDLHESSPFADPEAVLNTPNPGVLLTVMEDDHHRREKLVPTKPAVTSAVVTDGFIPLPGPNSDTGSTLTPNMQLSDVKPLRNILGSEGSSIGKPLQRWKAHTSSGGSKMEVNELSDDDMGLEDNENVDHNIDELDSALESSQDSVALVVSTSSGLAPATSVLSTMLTPGTNLVQVTPDTPGICFLQVMIKSPNGEVVPVQIPAALSASVAVMSSAGSGAEPTGDASTSNSCGNSTKLSSVLTSISKSSSASSSMGIASTTKQRLKAAIQQNVQQSVLQNNMQVMSDAVDLVTTQLQLQSSPSTSHHLRPASLVPVEENPACLVKMSSQVQLQDADTSTPKKARLSTDDDPDERRKKFLERNRAAAARCRQKKKVWVTNLEQKAEDLQSANSRLQAEVVELRGEVHQLKAMLLAHKDCPVTQRQRALQGEAV